MKSGSGSGPQKIVLAGLVYGAGNAGVHMQHWHRGWGWARYGEEDPSNG